MTIKFGELTIIHNEDEIGIISNIITWIGYEKPITTKSKFVFLFDDGEIYDNENNLKDFKYEFFIGISNSLPTYFEKNKEKTEKTEKTEKRPKKVYFYKNPVKKENREVLNFIPLFSSYKYNASMNIASRFNCIYYCFKDIKQPDIFGLLRIKSSENKPRFYFAYDSEEFTKEEVIYIINSIFKN
jgi:hypothetical protein